MTVSKCKFTLNEQPLSLFEKRTLTYTVGRAWRARTGTLRALTTRSSGVPSGICIGVRRLRNFLMTIIETSEEPLTMVKYCCFIPLRFSVFLTLVVDRLTSCFRFEGPVCPSLSSGSVVVMLLTTVY